MLNEIGTHGQEKLINSKVLVVGAGGLGSSILYYLGAAGIGTIGIVDFDEVDLTNLQRQIIHFTDDLGKKKVESAAEKLQKINPDLKVIKYPVKLDEDNIKDLVKQYDVVVNAVDNLAIRYLLSDCCYTLKKVLVEAGVTGFDGIIMTIIPDKSPCYRCFMPECSEDNAISVCTDVGIIGMAAGIIGSLQALEVVKTILDIGNTLFDRILYFDGLALDFKEIKREKRSNCFLCG